MPELTRTPYASTRVPASATKGEIEEMLKKFGAKAMRWTETKDSMQLKECPILEFVLETEIKGVAKEFGIRIQPPMLRRGRRRHGTHGEIVYAPDPNASMRMLLWYLKARMEAVAYGMDDMVETFMSKIMVRLPEGTTRTMGKVIQERPEVLRRLLPTFEIVDSSPAEEEGKFIEATAEVVGEMVDERTSQRSS